MFERQGLLSMLRVDLVDDAKALNKQQSNRSDNDLIVVNERIHVNNDVFTSSNVPRLRSI
jgi:hypothetical protein